MRINDLQVRGLSYLVNSQYIKNIVRNIAILLAVVAILFDDRLLSLMRKWHRALLRQSA